MELTIVSLDNPRWIEISFSEPRKGFNSVEVWYEQLLGIWTGDDRIAVSIDYGRIWFLSYNGTQYSKKVVSVNGVPPTDNEHLKTLIRGLRQE